LNRKTQLPASTERSLMQLQPHLVAMNELAMNLSPKRVDYGYLKVLIVGEAIVTKVLSKFFAMHDRFGAGHEFNA
jgi:hypothetical protein